MKRPPLITVAIALQFLLGSVLAGLTIYVLVLTRSPETLAEPDAAGTIRGLLIGAAVLGFPALITLISVFGLWKRRFWGWVLAFATDVGMLAVLVYNLVSESERDSDEIAAAAGVAVILVLLMLPKVREFYWKATANLNS
jgi:uncharacterized membrane protein (DUF2068 family)